MNESQRDEVARILEMIAKEGMPHPRNLDAALDAIADTLGPDSIFKDPEETTPLFVGAKVVKTKGYAWPGVVVSVFCNLKGQTRYVVECTAPEVAGALHIFNREQLRLAEE